MSETFDRSLDESLEGMRQCVAAARALLPLRRLCMDAENPFTCYLNQSLSAILHLLSDFAQSGSAAQAYDEPWFDFDNEPWTVEDAEAQLPEFLERLEAVFFAAPGPYPFMCGNIRATTFALLLEPEPE